MQPNRPRHPHIRAVRREIDAPAPKRRFRRWGARLRAALLLAVLAGGGWYFWQQVRAPKAGSQAVAIVRHGVVEESLEVDALIIRREQVVTAPVGGQVRRLANEGERVRVGSPVVEIGAGAAAPLVGSSHAAQPATAPAPSVTAAATSAAQKEYDRLSAEIYQLVAALNEARYSGQAERATSLQVQVDDLARRQIALLSQLQQRQMPQLPGPVTRPSPPPESTPGATQVTTTAAGVLLYQTDGLESILSPAEADKWSPSWLRALPYPEMAKTSDQGVAPGQPLFKVVDDLQLEMVAVVPAARFTPSQRTIMAQDGVTLWLPGKDRAVTARVERMAEEGEELLLHLSAPLPASEALRVRRMRVRLQLETFEGIILPRSAIDVQDGKTGVWVTDGSTYRFTPVRAIGGNRQEVAVEGDLAPGDQVLKELPPPPR